MVITYTLSQLQSLVSKGFKQLFAHFFCNLKADISAIKGYKERRYLTLVEAGQEHEIIASIKGVVFEPLVIEYLFTTYHLSPLDLVGKQCNFQGRLSHHMQYGISFIIERIDIVDESIRHQYTHTIMQSLRAAGIYDANRRLSRPLHPYRVAIITGQGSEGSRDVVSLLDDSLYILEIEYCYCAIHGNEAALEVKEQLHKLAHRIQQYHDIDLILIARGGGDSSGFARQDNDALAHEVCLCPVPIIVAIGHTTNTSLLDEICHTSAKTPSDAAYRIISHIAHTQNLLKESIDHIDRYVAVQLTYHQQVISTMYDSINYSSTNQFTSISQHIKACYDKIISQNPVHILQQGYVYLTDLQHVPVSVAQLSQLEPLHKMIMHTASGSRYITLNEQKCIKSE